VRVRAALAAAFRIVACFDPVSELETDTVCPKRAFSNSEFIVLFSFTLILDTRASRRTEGELGIMYVAGTRHSASVETKKEKSREPCIDGRSRG